MSMLEFNQWDHLLRRYVNDQGRVNYVGWKESAAELQSWLEEISQVDLKECQQPNQRLALWLNLYNALTIAQVLERYPIQSIRPAVLGVPNWIGFFQFFSRSRYELGGQKLSLNTIEHGILRQEFQDPRIHFALVCASIGCPLLRNEAYFPETVQSQLEADADRFINNPDKVKWDARSGILYCSKIFKWYGKDFLQLAPSVPEYIQTYLVASNTLNSATPIRYLPYDWNLNRQ